MAKKYRYIAGCGRMQGKNSREIATILASAVECGAPDDAIEQRKNGTWMVLSDMPKPIQRRIVARADRP